MKNGIKQMARVVMLAIMLMAVAIPASAEKWTGKVGGKYPVVVYIYPDGNKVTGRYAYKSTLKKNGDKPSSWLYITGSTDGFGAKGTTYSCVVRDNNGKVVEHWELDYYSWGVGATITTSNGKVYTLDLNRAR